MFIKKVFLLSLSLFLFFHQGWCRVDSLYINGTILTASNSVNINRFSEGKEIPVASVPVINHTFSLKFLETDIPEGILRVYYDNINQKYVDIIWTGQEDINFKIDSIYHRNLLIEKSETNKEWYKFQDEYADLIQRMSVLEYYLEKYPKKASRSYQVINVEKFKVERQLTKLMNRYSTKKGWISKLIESLPKTVDESLVAYWNNKKVEDLSLWQTPYYNDLIISYLSQIFQIPISNQKQGVIMLKKCIDDIMFKFSGNAQGQAYALNLLTEIYKQVGSEEALNYLDTKYNSVIQCGTLLENGERESRINAYNTLKIGMPAPEISFENPETHKTFGLKDIADEKILLVFWSNSCPHCTAIMPKIDAESLTHKATGVIAISLDKDSLSYYKSAQKYPNILHYKDFNNVGNNPAKDYYITNTPTFFLLDKERRILGKYLSYDEAKTSIYNN